MTYGMLAAMFRDSPHGVEPLTQAGEMSGLHPSATERSFPDVDAIIGQQRFEGLLMAWGGR